jgi:hypothetical protein
LHLGLQRPNPGFAVAHLHLVALGGQPLVEAQGRGPVPGVLGSLSGVDDEGHGGLSGIGRLEEAHGEAPLLPFHGLKR